MRRVYKNIRFQKSRLEMIGVMNAIIEEYQAMGYVLTIRQLYYQLVAREVVPNTLQSYKNIASLCNDARLAGHMDWDAIEDRTREFLSVPHWSSGKDVLASAAASFNVDMWEDQPLRAFVIVEKEAMVGVLQRICARLDVPLMAARGYPSVTVLHDFARNVMLPTIRGGQEVLILHLGDHDPSGIDMTRDLEDRIGMFMDNKSFNLRRIALTWDQIEEQQPPPNPAKTTDSRFASYVEQFGEESFELDALKPNYIDDLVRSHIDAEIDQDKWQAKKDFVAKTREKLETIQRICFNNL